MAMAIYTRYTVSCLWGDLRIPDALLESAFTDGNDLNAIRPCYLHIVALRSFDGT